MGDKNLRPHHFYCSNFLDFKDPSRGSKFNEVVDEMEQLLASEVVQNIKIVEGPDDICSRCPFCIDGACRHPEGDEWEVRKWDRRLLNGLGLEYGKVITNEELRKLIARVYPLAFCLQKCRHDLCSVKSEKEAN